MKVTVSVKGRFHAFYLARELQRHGYLNRIITSYPVFETVKYGVERSKIKSLPIYEGDRIWRRAPRFVTERLNPQYLVSDLFDLHASRGVLEDTDIFVGFSSFSLHSLSRAKRLGAKTIVERGSSHMLHQRDILLEEYGRFGLKARVAHPKIVEKELAEYADADYISIPSHQQTSRTFEIPACGAFMLAERTDEHLRLFEEGKEAAYFGSNEELLEKVRYYLDHEDERRRIASAGRKRCLDSGYSHHERLKYMLSVVIGRAA